MTLYLYPVMVNGIGTVYPRGSNKVFSSRFCVGSRIRHKIPELGRGTNRSEHCEYNKEDEANDPNMLSNNDYQASSKKLRQIYIYIYVYIYHHHHEVMLPAGISLTLTHHSFLSFIASGGSSGLQSVSS